MNPNGIMKNRSLMKSKQEAATGRQKKVFSRVEQTDSSSWMEVEGNQRH